MTAPVQPKPPSGRAPRQPGKRRRLSVEARRAALVEAAVSLFEERPFDQVSTEDIARVAGVSQSLIFHYFPSKAGLYEAALQASVDTLVGEIAAAIEQADNPIERTLVGMQAYFDYVRARGARFTGVLRGESAVAGEAAAALVVAGRSRLIALIRDQVVAAVPPEELGDERLFRAGLTSWFGFVQELAIDWVEHDDLSRDELLVMSVRAMLAALPGLLPSVVRNATPELLTRYAGLFAAIAGPTGPE